MGSFSPWFVFCTHHTPNLGWLCSLLGFLITTFICISPCSSPWQVNLDLTSLLDGEDKKSKNKRGVLPKHATNIMRSWLFQHLMVSIAATGMPCRAYQVDCMRWGKAALQAGKKGKANKQTKCTNCGGDLSQFRVFGGTKWLCLLYFESTGSLTVFTTGANYAFYALTLCMEKQTKPRGEKPKYMIFIHLCSWVNEHFVQLTVPKYTFLASQRGLPATAALADIIVALWRLTKIQNHKIDPFWGLLLGGHVPTQRVLRGCKQDIFMQGDCLPTRGLEKGQKLNFLFFLCNWAKKLFKCHLQRVTRWYPGWWMSPPPPHPGNGKMEDSPKKHLGEKPILKVTHDMEQHGNFPAFLLWEILDLLL